MICKNCGAQTEGNFCNNCGVPLPKEVAGNNESMDAEYKVYNEEDAQKENQQQKNVKVTIKNKRGGSSRNTRTTQTKRKRRSAGKSVKTAGNLLFTGLHWLCALLMLGIVLQIFRNVFNYTSIGAIMELPSSRDINSIIFVGGSAFFILFGIIEALWILGSKKVMDMGVLRNIDTGRGIFAFGLFLIITILAPFIDGFLSLGYNGIEGEGGRWILDAFTGSKTILTFAAAGLILSFVRKMRGSIRGMIA